MKTIALLFTVLTLSFATVPSYGQLSSGSTTPQIFQKIQENVRVPESMKSNVSAERVCVVFTIDENGHAHVVDVASARPDLRNPVIRQFEAIDFSGIGGTEGQTYSIWLNFKVI